MNFPGIPVFGTAPEGTGRFIVDVDEKLTAFIGLEFAIRVARLGAPREPCARLSSPQAIVLLRFVKG